MSRKIMMVKLFMLLTALLYIAGCSVSEREAIDSTNNAVEKTFLAPPKDADQKATVFQYYLPKGFTVESENENNVLLTTNHYTYILFVNPFEPLSSQVVYDSTKAGISGDNILKRTYEDEHGRFGYVIINPLKERMYEISVGIGGVKMTTQTKKGDLAEQAEVMMEIVRSVKY
jgi:hypothetical protein